MRSAILIGAGLVSGLVLGAGGLMSIFAAKVYQDKVDWPTLTPEYLSALAICATIGAVNGSVGAWDGIRSQRWRLWPVAIVPVLMLTYPLPSCLEYPNDSKTWGLLLFLAFWVGLFVWVAGRIGQEIGVRGSRHT